MSILLAVELKIPINVGELRFQPQLFPTFPECTKLYVFSLLAAVLETSQKHIVLYAHCLFCMSGMETRL